MNPINKRGSASVILALLFLLTSQHGSASSWTYVPLAQKVAESDAIVIGPLTGIQGHSDIVNNARRIKNRISGSYDDDYTTYTGYIVVEKALAGNVKAGDRLEFACATLNRPWYFEKSSIWLLTKSGDQYRCYPRGGWEELAAEAEVVQLLHEPVTLLSARYEHPASVNIPVQLRIRNTTEKPMTIYPPDVSRNVDVTTSGTQPVRVLIRFHEDKTTGTLTIKAGKQISFPLVLNKIMKLDPDTEYGIKAAVDGLPVSSELELNVRAR